MVTVFIHSGKKIIKQSINCEGDWGGMLPCGLELDVLDALMDILALTITLRLRASLCTRDNNNNIYILQITQHFAIYLQALLRALTYRITTCYVSTGVARKKMKCLSSSVFPCCCSNCSHCSNTVNSRGYDVVMEVHRMDLPFMSFSSACQS